MKYFLSLGSNVGNRKRNLALAQTLLKNKGVRILQASSVYKTQPVDFSDQPWFYNQVLEIQASSGPLTLLTLLKAIEQEMKRVPTVDKGPRTIDIDILLAGKTVIQTRKLMIPHPQLIRRNFVLIPLDEIAPHAVHPLLHEKIEDLMRESQDTSTVKKIGTRPGTGSEAKKARKNNPSGGRRQAGIHPPN